MSNTKKPKVINIDTPELMDSFIDLVLNDIMKGGDDDDDGSCDLANSILGEKQ